LARQGTGRGDWAWPETAIQLRTFMDAAKDEANDHAAPPCTFRLWLQGERHGSSGQTELECGAPQSAVGPTPLPRPSGQRRRRRRQNEASPSRQECGTKQRPQESLHRLAAPLQSGAYAYPRPCEPPPPQQWQPQQFHRCLREAQTPNAGPPGAGSRWGAAFAGEVARTAQGGPPVATRALSCS